MILNWSLSVEPAQPAEYWLVYVDDNPFKVLREPPYNGVGKYSLDVDSLELPAGTYALSVALVGAGVIGPQSPAVSVDISDVPIPSEPPPPVPVPEVIWPSADSVAIL